MGTNLRAVLFCLVVGLVVSACGSSGFTQEEVDEIVAQAVQDALADQRETPASTTTTTAAATTTTQATTTTTRATTTTTEPFEARASDFTIELITTDKSCFGSAGANLQFELDLTVSNRALLRGSGDWLVIYEVDPVEDGPEISNIEVDLDSGRYEYDRLFVSTDDCDDEPEAVVTGVRRR